MSDTFRAMWPVENDELALDRLVDLALPTLPEIAAEVGAMINTERVDWALLESDDLEDAPASPTGLVLVATMLGTASKIDRPVLEALNHRFGVPWRALEGRYGTPMATLAAQTSQTVFTREEAQVCMSLSARQSWRMSDGVLVPVGVPS